ncbi:AraC family transcriptional regulator [Methylobacterium sp. E-045]|uniref:AraC family transcriptional regulator n=1 Tax=Methylobacterium sp. E-045 TaxID=2836575 RepID=UPI001FB9A893|nr:helix-turn-helix transcriptional regulator [Methylobacterium sp. E-045]MCJ2128249.1 helix-turn-helix transcriptional regulator [Methylobacterium sp. E-045]
MSKYHRIKSRSRQYPPMKRQSTSLRFRTMQGKFAAGFVYEQHVHEQAQLIFTVSGTIQVATDVGRWLVPPQLAVWAPTNAAHSVEVVSDAESWSIYYDDQACRRWAPRGLPERPFVLRMTPILRELLRGLFEGSPSSQKAELMVRLILHEFIEVPAPPTFLPLPTSHIGRRLAGLALADPMCRLSLSQLAALAATSPRTISRLFPDETGLTFKSWRQRARIIAAIDRLAMGDTMLSAAGFVGFTSLSSFAHSFRAVTGSSVYDFGT